VAQLARMEAATNFEGAYNILSETSYAASLSKLKKAFDFEELCRLELEKVITLVKRLSDQSPFVLALLEKHQVSDYQAYFKKLKATAADQTPLLHRLVNSQLDLINLKLLLRTQALGKDKDFLKTSLVESGMIDTSILLGLFDRQPHEIALRLSYTPYFPALSQGLDFYARNHSFFLLEKAMDDFILSEFHRAKYKGAGVEPLVGYYLAKEAELKKIRFILICKQNQITAETIRERIRINY
jgi:V/A-type H+-transporting ATPase subunit C